MHQFHCLVVPGPGCLYGNWYKAASCKLHDEITATLTRWNTNLLRSTNDCQHLAIVDASRVAIGRQQAAELEGMIEQVCSIRQPVQRNVSEILRDIRRCVVNGNGCSRILFYAVGGTSVGPGGTNTPPTVE